MIGDVGTVLGMRVLQDKLIQPAYIRQSARPLFGTRQEALTIDTATLGCQDGAHRRASRALTRHQELVGCLLWLAGCTWPDLMYAASYLSRSLAAPYVRPHWDLVL